MLSPCSITSLVTFPNFRWCTCVAATGDIDDLPHDSTDHWPDDSWEWKTAENNKTFKLVYNYNEIQLYMKYTSTDSLTIEWCTAG